MQDTSEIKEKIIRIIRIRGPSLPVHIAKEIDQSILFTSAFLSELLSEKKIKISDLKVGNSPVYFIQGQEYQLERFSNHLKNKEKDAFNLLKEKKFLKDYEQQPAIKVALRSIKDFAVAFKKEDEIFWRYFNVPESELIIKEKPKILAQTLHPSEKISVLTTSPIRVGGRAPNTQKQKSINIFDKKKKTRKKPSPQKKNEKFFNKVKEFLSKKSIEILDIEGFSKNDLTLRVKDNEKEKLLIAHNKKRINELDLIKANKKAAELRLPYIILSLGEPLKKLKDLIEATKNLSNIEKIE